MSEAPSPRPTTRSRAGRRRAAIGVGILAAALTALALAARGGGSGGTAAPADARRPADAGAPTTRDGEPGGSRGARRPGGTKFRRTASRPVAGSYIVRLPGAGSRAGKSEVARIAADMSGRCGVAAPDAEHTWGHAVRGFVVHATEAQARCLSEDPRASYVAEDGIVHRDGDRPSAVAGQAGAGRTLREERASPDGVFGANDFVFPAPLDRIDQRFLPLNQQYNPHATGFGSVVWMIDSGILATHIDFQNVPVPPGRNPADLVWVDFVHDGNGTNDCVTTIPGGHGTLVSSIVQGRLTGVSPDAYLVILRVLDCNDDSPFSRVTSAVEWVADHAGDRDVVNMSLGGPAGPDSDPLDAAITSLVNDPDHPVPVVVSAGNQSSDACNFSPSRVPAAITVAGRLSNDVYDPISNFGPCVDIYAPDAVGPAFCASNAGDTLHNQCLGTSCAAPFVTGVMAQYLSRYPTHRPGEMEARLLRDATPNVMVNNPPGTPNLLIYSNAVPWFAENAAAQDSGNNLLADFSFEEQSPLWHATSPAVFNNAFLVAQNGVWKALLVATAPGAVRQVVTNRNATDTELIFRIRTNTTQVTTTLLDTMQVTAQVAGEPNVSRSVVYDNRYSSTTYLRKWMVVPPGANQVVFESLAHSGPGDTQFLIDNVHLIQYAPIGRGDLVVNGSFESPDLSAWHASMPGSTWRVNTGPKYEGSWTARMGSPPNTAHVDTLYQDVVVPNFNTGAAISLAVNVQSADMSASARSTLSVNLVSPSTGDVIEAGRTFSNLDRTHGWVVFRFSPLSNEAATTVRLLFTATTPGGTPPTTFYIDGVHAPYQTYGTGTP